MEFQGPHCVTGLPLGMDPKIPSAYRELPLYPDFVQNGLIFNAADTKLGWTLAEREHDSGIERAHDVTPSNREHEIASIVSDMKGLIIRLDQLGLTLAAARASHAIDSIKEP